MRLYFLIAAAVVLMGVLSFCDAGADKSIFGIDVSDAEVVADTDSHGWLGDGERYSELKFSDASAEIEISKSWQPLPASERITAIIWGTEFENNGERYGVGPYMSAELPQVENGWYYFEDRTEQIDGATPNLNGGAPDSDSAAALYLSPPRNFTVAVYDSDTATLYYVDHDS